MHSVYWKPGASPPGLGPDREESVRSKGDGFLYIYEETTDVCASA